MPIFKLYKNSNYISSLQQKNILQKTTNIISYYKVLTQKRSTYSTQMNSTQQPSSYLQKLSQSINPSQLQLFLDLFTLASSGNTTQSQQKVFNLLKQVQQKPQSYLYFLYIFLNPNYTQTLRYITGTTLNSSLKRNSKEIHFQLSQKDLMKMALLHSNVNQTKLKAMQNVLISQLVICFQQVDWSMIYFFINKIQTHPDILPLISTIFQDIKHNSQNLSYFQGTVQTQIIQSLLSNLHTFMFTIINKLNKKQQSNQSIKNLTEAIKLIRIITFHLPLKLSQYFHNYMYEVANPLLRYLIHLLNSTKQTSQNNWFNNLFVQIFQSINQVSQTKSCYLLQNKQFLDLFLIQIPISNQQFRSHNQELLKIWTNTLLQLASNDKLPLQQPSRNQKLFCYLEIVLPKLLMGFKFTKQDQLNIISQMEIQHNPYQNQNQSDEEQQFQATHGKAHGTTVRKVSITCMEYLSNTYNQQLWANSKPIIYQLFKQKNDYKIIQSAILFIGIISQKCLDQLALDSQQIISILAVFLSNIKQQIVIATTLWTFQKLIFCYSQNQSIKQSIYELIYKIMGNRMEYEYLNKSKNHMVKEAAVSLLDQLISNQTETNTLIITNMLESLVYALQQFTGRALFNVFKTISTIFQQPERKDIQSTLVNQIVKKLCIKWSHCVHKDSIMCPLIECLSLICENRKSYFLVLSPQILHQIYPLFMQKQRKQLVLRVIDLATSIISSSKQFTADQNFIKISEMVSSLQFLQTVHNLITSQQKQIRHFGYGLLSDIIKLRKVTDSQAQTFISVIAKTLDSSNPTSTNNAIMCLTDIVQVHQIVGKKFTSDIIRVVVRFLSQFQSKKLPKIYLLNFSRIFGRLANIDQANAKVYLLNSASLLKDISSGLKSQQQSQLTMQAFIGLSKLFETLSFEQLFSLINSKDIEHFVDSFMGYRYNLQNNNMLNTIVRLLLKIRQIVLSKNISWSQYLNSTILYPATINRILQMTR